jgi:hypothetical protein
MQIKKSALLLFTLLSINIYAQEEKKYMYVGRYTTTKDEYQCDKMVYETLPINFENINTEDAKFMKAHENNRPASTYFAPWETAIVFEYTNKSCSARQISWLSADTIDACETILKNRIADGEFSSANIVFRWGVN